MQKLTPFLWFNDKAEAAVDFYVGIFPDARIDKVLRYSQTGPGPEGSVMTIAFTLAGQQYTALNGGPRFSFNGAISFVIDCGHQAEIDYYWEELGAGGQYHACGWVTDRFGLTWQVVPRCLPELLGHADPAVSERVMQAMLTMTKLEIAPLERVARQASEV